MDFAILYRTNAQSRILEETLRKKNIPYKIYGGLSFYERKEIKDLLAYFRLVSNPEDEEALKRAINYPKRGIGDTTIQKVLDLASGLGITPWQILATAGEHEEHFNASTARKLLDFAGTINNMRQNADSADAYSKAREIAAGSGIMKELKEGKTPEEVSRYENLEELLNGIKIFTESAETNGEPATLTAYMANVSLLTDQDTETAEDRNKVTLMTIHSAKGLEFKHVYIAGMEDTLFPSPMSSGSARELEEERRLFYVAVTRAEKQATLSYALNRYKWGNLERSNPSRFIREIDQQYLQYPQTGGKPFGQATQHQVKSHPGPDAPKPFLGEPKLRKISPAPAVQATTTGGTDVTSLNVGDMVQHDRFGTGTIRAIEGQPPNTTATVEFDKEGTKKLLLRFAKLRKI
jgi:DNA helicase-2/ATP-dependent DNA helicase PcrA